MKSNNNSKEVTDFKTTKLHPPKISYRDHTPTKDEQEKLKVYAKKRKLKYSKVLSDYTDYVGILKTSKTSDKPFKVKTKREYIPKTLGKLTEHETNLYRGMVKRVPVKDRLEANQLPAHIGIKWLRQTVKTDWIKVKDAGNRMKPPIPVSCKGKITIKEAREIAQIHNPFIGAEDAQGRNRYEIAVDSYVQLKALKKRKEQ